MALEGDPERADDLVQDCLERAIRKRHLWRRHGRLRGWMFRILYRTFVNNRVRSRRRGPVVPLEDVQEETAQAPRQEQRVACLHVTTALDQLPEEQKAAILLIALEGMSYDEAAWILGIPIGTLRSRLSRGRATLQGLTASEPQPKLKRVK